MSLRSVIRRVPGARRAFHRAMAVEAAVIRRLGPRLTLERLPAAVAVPLIYEVMLGWRPALDDVSNHTSAIERGELSRQELAQMVRGTEEFNTNARYTGRLLGYSIHAGRCQFIRLLPKANRILDLGGTHQYRDIGALVGLGYPYAFEELVIVDLPQDERHQIYQSAPQLNDVESPLGPVGYRYHSMTDLSSYADGTFGLVYSGQSFEHVTPVDGAAVLREVYRVLQPGAYLALDTPNARVTRLQQDEFIDPDHKVEYELDALLELLDHAGFVEPVTMGLNFAGASLAAGKFDVDEVARNSGLYSEARDCYILCVVVRKPLEPLAG